jgi:LmbE family N-acetylglucosaminyl deacetylase
MSTQILAESTAHTLGIAPSEHVLAVNAHGDDEAMAEAQTIANLRAEGIELYAATVSDGEQNGDPLERRSEVNTAYDRYGIRPENRFYFGMPDSELHQKRTTVGLAHRLGTVAIDHNITTIITPGWEGFDGHSDHRAVHLASMLAAALFTKHDIAIIALDPAGELVIPVNADFKLDALSVYCSQFKGRHDEIAQRHYPHFLEHETYTRLDPHAHLDRVLQDLSQIQQYIPQV